MDVAGFSFSPSFLLESSWSLSFAFALVSLVLPLSFFFPAIVMSSEVWCDRRRMEKNVLGVRAGTIG